MAWGTGDQEAHLRFSQVVLLNPHQGRTLSCGGRDMFEVFSSLSQ